MPTYPYLTNDRGYTMDHREMRAAIFGHDDYAGRAPAEAQTDDWIEVQGVKVQFMSSETAMDFWSDRARRGKVGMAIRAVAMCPCCNRVVAASRINQHARVHHAGVRKGY